MPLLLLVIDLTLRWSTISKLTADFKFYYLTSIAFGIFYWYALIGWVRALGNRSQFLAWLLALSGGFGFAFFVMGALAFLDHFSSLPNVYAFEYLLDEPNDCLVYAKDALTGSHVLALLVTAVALACYVRFSASRPGIAAGRRDAAVTLLVFASLVLVFNNNVRMGPNAFTPDIHAIFSFTKAIETAITGKQQVAVLSTAARMEVRPRLGKLPFHVILILNESIRAQNQSAFGYDRPTTPRLQNLFESRPQSVVRFDRAYANATRTMMAFPSFFTGVVPSQSGGLLHHVPSFFDYARAFSDARTFLISTQSMHWGNFDRFLDASHLDFAWYKEASEFANTDADRFESLDDKYLPAAFARMLAGKTADEHLFGVIQLTNTHAPYGFEKEDELWPDRRLTDNYDSSIHYHDRQLGRLLDELERRGLLSETLIISTSDHGEAFGEHGYSGHLNTFYDEEARVPLWVHLPDALARDQSLVARLRLNAKQSVTNADVLPTVLSLAVGKNFHDFAPYLSQLTGMSLDRPMPPRAIMMQNYNDIDEKTLFVGLGVVYGKYKYLLKFNAGQGEQELYDLDVDPDEQDNIWATVAPEIQKAIIGHILRFKNSKELYLKAFPDGVDRS